MYPKFYFRASWAGKLINLITPKYKILNKLEKTNQSKDIFFLKKAQTYLKLEL